jgi:hypothetical protein
MRTIIPYVHTHTAREDPTYVYTIRYSYYTLVRIHFQNCDLDVYTGVKLILLDGV